MSAMHETGDRDRASDANDHLRTALDGRYLTDGETLFHIERTLVSDPRGELLVELEDCATLELIVCSARSIPDLGLHLVLPFAQTAS
jgi:hypothetical protein